MVSYSFPFKPCGAFCAVFFEASPVARARSGDRLPPNLAVIGQLPKRLSAEMAWLALLFASHLVD